MAPKDNGGMMEKIKRKSGFRFRESIVINGRVLKSPVFKRKTDCIQWLADQRVRKTELALYGENFKFKEKLSFKEYSLKWLEAKRSMGLSVSTMGNYEGYLRIHILPALGDKDIKRIEKRDIEKLQSGLMVNHKPKGTNLVMTALKSIFKEAVKDGYLTRNPTNGFKALVEDSNIEAYWTKSEIDQFLSANHRDKYYDFILIALNTGMRRGEIGALKWDRVDFSLNQITISRTRDKSGLKERTKTKLKRIVPMNQISRAVLLKLFYARKSSEFVFVNEEDSPIELHHLYRHFSRSQKKAGIINRIRFHDLRHTFASQFMMNNGNVFDLQKILGHTDIKMTMRYAHYSPEHLQRAIQGFELGFSDELTQISPTASGIDMEKKFESVALIG